MNLRNAYPLETEVESWIWFKASIYLSICLSIRPSVPPSLPLSQRQKRERGREESQQHSERDRQKGGCIHGKSGDREERERKTERLCLKHNLGGKNGLIFSHCMLQVQCAFCFYTTTDLGLLASTSLVRGPLWVEGSAPQPTTSSWLAFITGVTSLQLVIQRRNRMWNQAWVFSFELSCTSSLSMDEFVTEDSSMRNSHKVRPSEGLVCGEQEGGGECVFTSVFQTRTDPLWGLIEDQRQMQKSATEV